MHDRQFSQNLNTDPQDSLNTGSLGNSTMLRDLILVKLDSDTSKDRSGSIENWVDTCSNFKSLHQTKLLSSDKIGIAGHMKLMALHISKLMWVFDDRRDAPKPLQDELPAHRGHRHRSVVSEIQIVNTFVLKELKQIWFWGYFGDAHIHRCLAGNPELHIR
jgi:hypothetical protein